MRDARCPTAPSCSADRAAARWMTGRFGAERRSWPPSNLRRNGSSPPWRPTRRILELLADELTARRRYRGACRQPRRLPLLCHRRRRRARRGRPPRRRGRRLPRSGAAVPGPRARRARSSTSSRCRSCADVGPFFERVQRLAAVMPGALGAQGTFVANNNVVSQSVAHLHVHVVPRTKGDGLRGFFWPRTKYREGEAAASRRGCATRSPRPPDRLRPALRKGFASRQLQMQRASMLACAGTVPCSICPGLRARDRSRPRDSSRATLLGTTISKEDPWQPRQSSSMQSRPRRACPRRTLSGRSVRSSTT